MQIIEEHIVPEGITNIRLSDYLPNIFMSLPSKKAVKKAIKSGSVLVNDEVTNTGHWVVAKQRITLLKQTTLLPKVYAFPLPVIFEDEYLAIINKPAGIPVSGNQFHTIQQALAFNLTLSSQKDALPVFRPVHRLDAPTSGLLIIAKTKKAQIELGQAFEQKTIQKCYGAMIWGETPKDGIFEVPIEQQIAITRYHSIKTYHLEKERVISLVELYPETGRTHQIRRHLSMFGTPILGDKLYGHQITPSGISGLFLYAKRLQFQHPIISEPLSFETPAPKKFDKLIKKIKRHTSLH